MKTILPALIFLLFNGVLLAQDNSSGESTPAFPNPGVELGGQISFSSTSISDGDYSTTVFSFEPYIGAMLVMDYTDRLYFAGCQPRRA